MKIETRYNLGDTVFHATQDLQFDNDCCESCGRRLPGILGPIYAVEAVVSRIMIRSRFSHDGETRHTEILYELGNIELDEEYLFDTAEEAVRSATSGRNDD